MTNIQIKASTKALESKILTRWNEKGPPKNGRIRSVTIYPWSVSGAGLRISELSFLERPAGGGLVGTTGSSFMACDNEGLLVCALCERYVLDSIEFPEDAEDDLIRLEHLLW